MNAKQLLQRPPVLWALITAFWLAVGILDAIQSLLLLDMLGRDTPPREVFAIGLGDWVLWSPLTLLLMAFARRYPLERCRGPAGLALLVGLGAAVASVKVFLDLLVELPLRTEFGMLGHRPPLEMLWYLFLARSLCYLLLAWSVLGVAYAAAYYDKYRERQLRASQLEAGLAQARLQVLKMQLDPHFLFNTLHAVSALMHQDIDLAEQMLVRLGDLLRLTLDSAGTHEVPLHQELDFVRPYLEIQQARFGDRLAVRLDVAPEARLARVPNLILQPLVENAIRHGIAPRPRGGRVEVRARRRDGMLRLEVCDDGPGLPEAGRGRFREGVGLTNTRARLQQLYGPAHRLELHNGAEAGLVVTLAIPFRDEPPAENDGDCDADPHPDRG
jgi:signal transduction histidine kinase